MRSCHSCNIRVLVAIACGLLTGVILGLGIWRLAVRIQRGVSTSVSSTPIQFCRNGGTWQNGRCICTEEWKGLRCTIANFCENSTYMDFTFDRIPVGRYGPSLQTCPAGTVNAGNPRATRLCNVSEYGEIELQNAMIGSCTENLQTLETQIKDITTESKSISAEAQILTSDASKLTPENITSATRVTGQIFNKSRGAESQAKRVAITTVSQILDASEDVFQRAAEIDSENSFSTLIEQMESYSFSLGDETVVEPNLAIQSVTRGSDSGSSVLFSVQKGSSGSLVSGETSVNKTADRLNPDGQTELQILLNTGENKDSCGFVVYQNNKLFQSKAFTATSNFSQKIVSGKINTNGQAPDVSVQMVFNPTYDRREFQLHSYACVYWNFSTKDWDTHGCQKDENSAGFLGCRCNHTTNFAVLMTFKKDYQYPESLDILSNIGCALSIAGLALTIMFQIVTRKIRKTSVTWVLVSLCTSMLIFNLLFVFGIENSNKNLISDSDISVNPNNNEIPVRDTTDTPNPSCTAIAALLHYFLLVTFTWNGLSATQLYFLLIRTMKPLPRHFILIISLVGWGVPAIVVGVTVGVIYAQSGNKSYWELDYRQEEICWLAIPRSDNFVKSPFLWSFIVPVTIILITNIAIFITITVKVLWKNNQNLTSTKKVSSLKKILSTLSIAVVFGITWILAYAMLINNDDIRIVFSYIFCLFNTTQGLQIFILYTVRTKVFQSKASKVLKSLSSSFDGVNPLPSMTPLRLRVRMYNMLRVIPSLNERFRLLEPSGMTEETSLSESDQAKSSTQ
ncbi:LOW QUALITY PROTEIN: adhesion G-protein coupled receptor G7 [Mesocricetus auratus]|uniref:LOW QUALITY PROTEIN: adhesion G-protein coupled receptor G7 n=1 Tax=Mesocricetus auratus TaxID=10036 RepID=A0ABM2XZD3_MESAU|nr:LOW QUALITY PROTEIN: adhesion G-protein coupled receptor G7 [Mesocricetus auratus]